MPADGWSKSQTPGVKGRHGDQALHTGRNEGREESNWRRQRSQVKMS